MKCNVIYYDGNISKPREISISLDEVNIRLNLFVKDKASIKWMFSDLTYEIHGKTLEIKNNKYPSTLLKIDDVEFSNYFISIFKSKNKFDIHNKLHYIS